MWISSVFFVCRHKVTRGEAGADRQTHTADQSVCIVAVPFTLYTALGATRAVPSLLGFSGGGEGIVVFACVLAREGGGGYPRKRVGIAVLRAGPSVAIRLKRQPVLRAGSCDSPPFSCCCYSGWGYS